MSQELAPTTDSWIDVVGPVGQLAERIGRTPFVPRSMQGRPEHVAAAILLGREMHLGPMAALRGIDVIEGRPSLTAQMLGARIYAAGHRIEWGEATDKKCSVRVTRGDGLGSAEVTWTLADAERAGLAGKANWKKYPRQMLRARALTEAASMACPDVALGLDAAETSADSTPAQTSDTTRISVRIAETDSKTEETVPLQLGPLPQIHDDSEPVSTATSEPAPKPHTAAQMRKLRAMLKDVPGTPDDHRELIRELCDLPDLASAKDLTYDQMSQAIDNLDQLLNPQVVDAEVIEE
jgi:hypothetical protein